MWHASYSEQEFIGFWLGYSRRDFRRPKPKPVASFSDTADDRRIHAYWQNEPQSTFFFPNIVVASEYAIDAVFARLNAAPGKKAPLSANSRILLLSELDTYFSATPLTLTQKPLAGSIAIAIAEATLRTDQPASREVTAASCKRTFAYAWSLALTRGMDMASLPQVRHRWADVYQLINPDAPAPNLYHGLSTELQALIVQSCLLSGQADLPAEDSLATLLLNGSSADISDWWDRFAGPHTVDISFRRLMSSSLMERDGYLRQGLAGIKATSDLPTAAMCAFIATTAAPGSLDYLELFRHLDRPGVAFLYALYAALQWPELILSERGGLGYRVLRDLTRNEDRWSHPTADIAYMELDALERPDAEVFFKGLDPTNDITVELMPNLTANFDRVRADEPVSEHLSEPVGIGPEHREKLEQAIDLLTQLINRGAKP